MTPERHKTEQRLRPLILDAMNRESGYEMARGFLRYEAYRKLKPPECAELYKRNIAGENFDDLIDELILKLTP